MNTKIIVCCHKETELPHDPNFIPIQGGRKIAQAKLPMQGDDTGDNISELNPSFCELTAQYWAWKNLKGVDIIGLCHYRRFFKLSGGCGRTYRLRSIEHKDIDTRLIPNVMKGHDLILPKPSIWAKAMYDLFSANVTGQQMQIFVRTFAKMHPEYQTAMVSYLNGNRYTGCNMAIMPWELFCQYNEFLFPVLFKVREHLKPLPYSYYNRALGMFAEILLPVWCKANNLKAKQVPVILLSAQQGQSQGYMTAMLPKYVATMANETMKNLKYTLANRRKNSTYISPFWDQYFANDGIAL